MDWLPLTLLCAFSLATADAATKRWLGDYSARELVLIRFTLTGALLSPLMLFVPWPALPLEFWSWIVFLVPLELLAMGLYMKAIRDGELGQTLPYLAFTPVFATLTGFLLLGEETSLKGFAGIALVTAGAYLLNLHRAFDGAVRDWLGPLRAIAAERGPRLMLAVAAIYSVTLVMGKGALQYAPPDFFGPFYFGVLGIAAVLVFGMEHPGTLSALWRRPGAGLFVALAMAVMVVTHFLAIQRVEAAYMVSVKRTSLLFGIVYGALWFHEARLGQNLVAGGLMVGGVFLIVL